MTAKGQHYLDFLPFLIHSAIEAAQLVSRWNSAEPLGVNGLLYPFFDNLIDEVLRGQTAAPPTVILNDASGQTEGRNSNVFIRLDRKGTIDRHSDGDAEVCVERRI